ncbi:MAG: dihydrofolate reductase [Pseudomonadota bacterium]|nr:dihydrofolate reductase [Pseudomonadota bacterium]
MDITLIAAVAKNRGISKDEKLLWHLPGDLPRFKKLTSGKPYIVGRKTFETHGALPGRLMMVLTRDTSYQAKGSVVVSSLEEALEACKNAGHSEVMIGGGGEIYKMALPHATKLLLTEVDDAPEADTFFPEVDFSLWQMLDEECIPAGETHPAFKYVNYKRKIAQAA